MKILGQSSGSSFIVEATEDELAKVAGYSYFSSMTRSPRGYGQGSGFTTGETILVAQIWSHLHQLAAKKDELDTLKKKLKDMQDILEKAESFCPTLPPPGSTTEI